MAKFLKFFFEYQSLLEETHRVEIWEEGTPTSTIELQAGAEPFVAENNNDVSEKYLGGIVPTVATVMMSATETFNSAYFSKQKYGDYLLKFFVNGAVKSNAIITPFEANDMDRNGGYPITLSAECGLRNLKNKKYVTSNTRVKLISVLKNCLAQIGFVDNFPIKVIDNTKCYDGSIVDAAPTKYWEAFCDDMDFEGLNCYEVIDRIRKPYNQVFFDHVNGCWFVRNVDEISSHDSTIRTYNWADLSFTELSYNRPTKAYIDRQGGFFGRMFSHQSVVVKKAKSNMPIRNTWGKMDNLTGWTFSGSAGLFYVISNGQLYNSKASFSTPEAVGVDESYVQSPQFLYVPYQTFAENEKLTIEADVKMGSILSNLRMQIITGFNGPGGIPNFLSTDGNWYSVENDQVPDYEGGNFFGTPIYEVKPSGGKIKIEIPRPPYHANNEFINQLNQIGSFGYWNNPFDPPFFPENAEYYLVIRIFYPERGESAAAESGSTDEIFGLFIDNINIKVGNNDANISEGFERKFTLDDTQDRETDLTVDLGIGWPSYPVGTDSLFKTMEDSSVVKYYSKSNMFLGETLDVFVSNSYLKVLGKRLQNYQGTIWESLGFGDLVSIMGVKYRLHNAKYNARMHNTDIKAVELANNSTSILDTETLKANDDEKLIEEKIDRAVNRLDIPEFSSVNFAKKVLPSGRSVIMLNEDMKMKSAFVSKFFSKSADGGIITTEAEFTDMNHLQIQPAASGTIALEEWVDERIDNTWKVGGNTQLEGVQYIGFGNTVINGQNEIIGQESGDLGVMLFGNEIARFTELGNFGVGIVEPSAVIHGHANVSGNADVVLLKATNLDINYFFSVSINPNLNQVRLNNSGTLRVRNTWQFDANAHFAINATTVDATLNAHVPNWGQVQALAATGIRFGEAVKSISTANITLSGTQTINGYAAQVGDRILVSGQTTASQNGIYIVATGAWTRATDSDTDLELRNFVYPITGGTFNGWKYKNSNGSAITVGTTAITYIVYDNNVEADPVFNAWKNTAQNKNLVYASSGTVDGAIPSFRSLLAADIPTLNQNTTGSAAILATPRTIAATGDATWSVSFNGSANATAALTLSNIADSGVGSAFVKITRNAKGLIAGTQSVVQADITGLLGANAITNTMLSNSGVTEGIYRSVTVNVKGIVTAASNPTTLAGYGITDVYTKTEADGRYVDLTTAQSVGGAKTFNSLLTINNRVYQTGLGGSTYFGEFAGASDDLSANNNVGIGNRALQNIKSGSNNVAIGYEAGCFRNPIPFGGFLTTNNNSIFVGNNTRSLSNGETNEIVIGHNAIGAGSNTVTIGSAATVSTNLFGTLRYGTLLRPNNIAGTNGQFLKTNGTQDAWEAITTSDISNLSSWAGSTSITMLGTVTAGTWNGTTIGTARGGTGLTALGAANQILRVNSGATALEYFTPTYINLSSLSSSATGLTYNNTTGVFSMTSGYTIPTTLAVNEIAYANAAGRLIGSGALMFSESRYINLAFGSGNAAFGVTSSGNNAFVQSPNGNLRLEAGVNSSFANNIISVSNHTFEKGIRANGSLGTAGQVLASTGTSVQWVAANAMLANTFIGFGNGSNVLTGTSALTWDFNQIHISGGLGMFNIGKGGADSEYWVDAVNTNLNLYGNSIVSRNNHNFSFKIALNGNYGSAGQVLTSQGSGANPTWTSVASGSVPLTSDRIAFGNSSNVLGSSGNFRYIQDRVLQINRNTDNSFFAFGYNFGLNEAVITSENGLGGYGVPMAIYAPSLKIGHMSGSGLQMVTVDNNGMLGKQAIPSGGGGGGTSLAATQIAFGSGSNTVTSSSDFIYSNGAVVMTNTSLSNVDIIRINGNDGYDRNIFFSEVGGTDNGAFVGYRAGVAGNPDPTMLTMLTVNANSVMGGIAIHRQNGHVYIGASPNSFVHSSSQISNNKLFVDGALRIETLRIGNRTVGTTVINGFTVLYLI
jgi:hypothetical protein